MTYRRWIGGSGAAWGTSTNWSPSGVPTSTDEAVFEAAATVNLGSTTRNCLHFVNVNNTLLTINSLVTVNVYGNLTNNGTITVTGSGLQHFNFAFDGVNDAYIYSNGPIYNVNFTFTKDTYKIYQDSNITLYRGTTNNWTGATGLLGRLTFNTGSWDMRGYAFTCSRIAMSSTGGSTRQWWMSGYLILRGSTGTRTSGGVSGSIYDLQSCTINDTSGRFVVCPGTLGQDSGGANDRLCSTTNALNTTYASAFNWTLGTFTYTIPGTSTQQTETITTTSRVSQNANGAQYKNFVVKDAELTASTQWNINDSFTVEGTTSQVASGTTLNFFCNNGQNATFTNTILPSSGTYTANFGQNTGTNGSVTINGSRANTNNLNSTNITYYLNHSSGTNQTFNCSSLGPATYYIKVTGSGTAGTINCNSGNSTFYIGGGIPGNDFSQTCGAYTLNCGTIAGSDCNFYYDSCTDNTATPCTITIGAASGSTTIGGGNHYIGNGLNIAGTLNFNGGTLHVRAGELPVVGTFNSCSNVSHETNARTFNWNGSYIRVNNQARTANTNGTGSVLIRNSTTTTSTSDMTSSITSNGGIQMESTGTFAVGIWTDTSCPRIKLVALGTAASTRTFGSTASQFRSINIEGPVSISSTNMSNTVIQFKGYDTGVTWNDVGSAANFNALNCYLGNLVNTNFTYNNSNALTDNTKRINTVAALEGVGSPPGNNTVYNIIAYTRGVNITKVNGTYNLNEINAQGYVICQPFYTGVDGVTFNWKNVVKPATTSGFVGYSTADDFRAYTTDNGGYTTHNITDSGIDVKGNKFRTGFPITTISQPSNTNVNAPILAETIEIGTDSRFSINGNYTFKNIALVSNINAILIANSDFTITGELQIASASTSIDITNRTITFTGQHSNTPINHTSTWIGTVNASGSNIIIRNASDGANKTIKLSAEKSYGTITNGCTFVHSSSGSGTGRLIIDGGSSGTASTINILQSEDNSVSRSWGRSGTTALNVTNPNFSGTSTNRNYVTGNWVKGSGGSVNLSWLGVVSSTVSGASGNWFAEDSIDYGSNSGWTILGTATYSITPTSSTMNEGANITVNVSTTNIPNATTLYWTIAHGTTVSADFTATSGSFTINSNAGSFTITTIADKTTEGNESFSIQLRTGSISGTVKATSDPITIIDTSLTPSYSASAAVNNVDENSSVTINITTTSVDNGTTLYWTVLNNTTTNQDFSAVSGSFTINSNSGSFNVTALRDYITEGSETFQVQIRTGSISGTVVATTGLITINDTTIYPMYIGFLQFF